MLSLDYGIIFPTMNGWMKRVRSITIFVLLVLLMAGRAYPEDSAPGLEKTGFYGDMLEDAGDVVTSPLRWDRGSWLKATLVVGTAAGLYFLDDEISEDFQRSRGETTDDISHIIEPVGGVEYVLPSLVALYAYGKYADSEKAVETSLAAIESVVIASSITYALKFATHRHRPESGDPGDRWDGPSLRDDDLSFPSGHATAAFALMTVVADKYREKRYVAPAAYGIAGLVALSRLNEDEHWASDVFLGSAIGYYTARAVLRLREQEGRESFAIYPAVGDRGTPLLMMSIQF